MVFKKMLLKLIFAAPLFLNSACTVPLSQLNGENVIGTPLADVSDLNRPDTTERTHVAVYDKTTNRIHEFNLDNSSVTRSHGVRFPEQVHYVLHDDDRRYTIDLTQRGISFISATGTVVHDPIRLLGRPRSAAFRPELGLLVIYDNLQSVGIIRISAAGQIDSTVTLGPIVSNDLSITAGDLTSDGRLILSLSDGQLAVVNTTQTLAQQAWVYTLQPTTYPSISWIGPSTTNANRLLLRTPTAVKIWDIGTAAEIATANLGSNVIERLSKSVDAHVITRSGASLNVLYADGDTIRNRNLVQRNDRLLASYLNLQENVWTSTWTNSTYWSPSFGVYNNPNSTKEERELVQFRLSDMFAQRRVSVRTDAQVSISRTFVFSLFSTPLGYATRTHIQTGQVSEMRLFNLPYLQ